MLALISTFRRPLIWLLASFAAISALGATRFRAQEYQLQAWNRDDGLPDNAAERLLLTRDGWLWVGTRNGLARFDGLKFTVFDRRTPGFTSDAVIDLAEDKEGNLWIATKRGLYRKSGGEFTKFTVADGLAHNQVNQILPEPDGGLWLATQRGVSRFSPNGIRSFPYGETIFPTVAESQVVNNIFCVAEAGYGGLWVGSPGGLQRFGKGTGEFRFVWRPGGPIDDLHGKEIQRMLRTRDGTLWLGGEYAAFRRDANGWATLPWPPDGGDRRCRQLIEDSRGAVWAVRAGRLFRLSLSGDQVEALDTSTPLTDAYVTDVLPALSGGLWLATRYSGLRKLSPAAVRLLTTSDGLPNNSVASVCAERGGGVWVATQRGVARWRDGQFEAPIAEIPFSTISAETIHEENGGDLWVARTGVADPQILWWEPTETGYRRLNVESGIRVSSFIAEDSQARLWMGGVRGVACLLTNYLPTVFPQGGQLGVHVHRKRASRWQITPTETSHIAGPYWDSFAGDRWRPSSLPGDPWRPLSEAPPERIASAPFPVNLRLPHPDVRAFAETDDGTVWLGTWGGGVLRLRAGVPTVFDESHGLAANQVHCLLRDASNDLWAGTARGLSRFDTPSGRWRSVAGEHGLPGEDIRQLLQDRAGNLWFGCDEGIGRLSRDDLAAIRAEANPVLNPILLDSVDGLIAGQTTSGHQSGACATPDGRLWFATPQGLAMIDPTLPLPERKAPRVFLEALRAGDWVHHFMDSKPWAPNGPLALRAGAGRSLSIEFTALDYAAPLRLQFRYRLQGHEEDWIEAGPRRVALYANLKPGAYRFEAQARGRFSRWEEASAAAPFVIAPFFWQTWLFQWGGALALALALLAAVRWRLAQLRRIARAENAATLARERESLAKDLHDDLGSRLAQISLLGELTSRDPSQAARVAILARETAQSLDSLVWTVHPERDSLRDLAAYLSQFAHEFISPTGLEIVLDMPAELPNAPVPASARKAVLLAVKESLRNVVRHASARRVRLALELGGGWFRVVVEDDGSGLPPDATARAIECGRGNGLRNMRGRLAEVKGSCAVENRPSGGARVTLHVPFPTQSS